MSFWKRLFGKKSSDSKNEIVAELHFELSNAHPRYKQQIALAIDDFKKIYPMAIQGKTRVFHFSDRCALSVDVQCDRSQVGSINDALGQVLKKHGLY